MGVNLIPLPVFKRMKFYLEILNTVANRSTCRPDRKAGAIIIDKEFRIVSMGYNGTPPGVKHCSDGGCIKYDGHCIGTLHAEMNALANLKVKEEGLIMVCTLKPCLYCLKMLMAFRISKIVYLKEYGDKAREVLLKSIKASPISRAYIRQYNFLIDDRYYLPGDIEILKLDSIGLPLFQGEDDNER